MPREALTEPGRDRDVCHRAEIDHLYLEAGGHPELQLEPVNTVLNDVAPRRDLLVEGPAYGPGSSCAARWSVRSGMMRAWRSKGPQRCVAKVRIGDQPVWTLTRPTPAH